MSVTAFLRRLSMEAGLSAPSSPSPDRKDSFPEDTGTPPRNIRSPVSARDSREGRPPYKSLLSRRQRIVQSIDSARRRFSLQHGAAGEAGENRGALGGFRAGSGTGSGHPGFETDSRTMSSWFRTDSGTMPKVVTVEQRW